MEKLARDVMQTHVISVELDLPLLDVHRLFVEEEINGAPVVDDTGRLLGVITSLDLLRAVEEEHESGSAYPRYFRDDLEFSGPDWTNAPEDFQDRLSELTVRDAMTTGAVTVSPDTPISEIASLLLRHRIHRVLVVERELLAGLISTFDLISLLSKEPVPKEGGAA